LASINDLVLQIHMTFLSNKTSVEWISSFKEDIVPLNESDFQRLVSMLEGVAQQEQENYMQSLQMNKIPVHLQRKAVDVGSLYHLIEHLKSEYIAWNA